MRRTNVVDLGDTDDVPGQAKVKMFDHLAYLVLSHTTAVSELEISQYNMEHGLIHVLHRTGKGAEHPAGEKPREVQK